MYALNTVGQRQFDTSISCCIIAAVAVIIRVFCKISNKSGVHGDDYWILVGLVFYWISIACVLWGSITGGGGIEMQELTVLAHKDPKKLKLVENYLEGLFLAYTFFICSMFAIKISILLFYRRIFLVKPNYRHASLVAMSLSALWFVAAQISNLLTCRPVDAFWHRTKPGKCFNFNVMFLGLGVAEVLIDTFILCLPIRTVFTLQMPKRTKVAVAGIFALGGFSIITNVVRIQYMYKPNSRYVRFAEAEMWSNIHALITVVTACLPVYKQLWASLSKLVGEVTTSFRSRYRSGGTTSSHSTYIHMDDRPKGASSVELKGKGSNASIGIGLTDSRDGTTTTKVVGGGDRTGTSAPQIPQCVIAYSREVDVV